MSIQLTDDDIFYIGMDLSEGGGKLVAITDSIRAGAEAQLKKVARLIKKDTDGNLFGISDKFYKTILKEAGLK